jgi:hypothetical protein
MILRMSVRCFSTLVISQVRFELMFVFFGYLAGKHGIAGGV